MRLFKFLILFFILSFFTCTGVLYADEVKPPIPSGAETKAPGGGDLDKSIKAVMDQVAQASEKEAPKAEATRTCGTDPASGLKVSYNPNGYSGSNRVYGVNFAHNFSFQHHSAATKR